MMTELRSVWFWLSVTLLGVLTLFLLYPVANIFYASFGLVEGKASGWSTLLNEPKYTRAILNSLLLGVAVTVTVLAIGVPLAYLSARYEFPGKSIVSVLPIITLVTPEVIVA